MVLPKTAYKPIENLYVYFKIHGSTSTKNNESTVSNIILLYQFIFSYGFFFSMLRTHEWMLLDKIYN